MREDATVADRVHARVLEAFGRDGCAPSVTQMALALGVGGSAVRRALLLLKERGALLQPAGSHGPYVPALDLEGRPVKVVLMPDGVGALGSWSNQELLEELARRLG